MRLEHPKPGFFELRFGISVRRTFVLFALSVPRFLAKQPVHEVQVRVDANIRCQLKTGMIKGYVEFAASHPARPFCPQRSLIGNRMRPSAWLGRRISSLHAGSPPRRADQHGYLFTLVWLFQFAGALREPAC